MAIGTAAALIGAAGAIGGGLLANKGAKDQAKAAEAMNDKQLAANAVDPRIQNMLYGDGTQRLRPGVSMAWSEPDEFGRQSATNPQTDFETNGGLLGNYMNAMNKPQSQAMQTVGKNASDYIAQNGASDMGAIRNGAMQQMGGIQAPGMQAAQMEAPLMGSVPMAQKSQIDMAGLSDLLNPANAIKRPTAAPLVQAATVSAPSQNGLDLKDAYNSMIYGEFGKNPYLTGAIQKGINQSQNAFTQMQSDATRNLSEFILPQVRGGALASGQYGSTRQGIAEGRAMSDNSRETQRAITQMNQYNTDAAVAAQAQAYKEDADRAASLMQSLGGQQYGVAATNANNAQAASTQNAANQLKFMTDNMHYDQNGVMQFGNWMLDAAKTNAGLSQGANLANQQAILGVGQNNQQTQFGTNTNNMNALNGAANNNLQSQLSTNSLNSQNLGAGMANLGGLLNSNIGQAQQQDQYGMNQLNNSMGVLAPYLAKNATPTQLQPVYNNSGAATIGGALAGAQLGGQISNAFSTFGGSGTGNPTLNGASNGYGTGTGNTYFDGYGWSKK